MKLKIDIDEAEYKTLSKMSETEKVNELSYYVDVDYLSKLEDTVYQQKIG